MGIAVEQVGAHERVELGLQRVWRMISANIQHLGFAVLGDEPFAMDPNQTDPARFALPQHFEVFRLLERVQDRAGSRRFFKGKNGRHARRRSAIDL
ncbi:hypothetical protein D9M70_579400 [compost metagenome]